MATSPLRAQISSSVHGLKHDEALAMQHKLHVQYGCTYTISATDC